MKVRRPLGSEGAGRILLISGSYRPMGQKPIVGGLLLLGTDCSGRFFPGLQKSNRPALRCIPTRAALPPGSDEVMAEQSKKMCVVGLCDTAANFRQFSSIDSDGIQRSNAQTNGLAYPIASLSKDL